MNLAEVVDRARAGNKHAIARLVGVFEDTRATGPAQRAQVLELLAMAPVGAVVGLTGTPGAGKSSLLARVVPALLAEDRQLRVAVLAIDPASHVSGGALLGDRTRTRFGGEERAYFRSQSNATELGGLAPTTFQVTRLLQRLFDLVIVETVGIGQSELDVRHLADHVYLVLQPLGGDEIQFLKAGIVEVPDSFVLNKCDDPAANVSYYQLRSALSLARPFEDLPPVMRTSARTGEGIEELLCPPARGRRGPTASHRRRQGQVFLRKVGRRGMGRGGAPLRRDGARPLGAGRWFRRRPGPVRRSDH